MFRTDFWTLWEKERVGWFGRMALKHVYYHVRNEVPVYVRYRMLGAGAWGWPRGMLWGGRWEGGSCLGTHVRMKDFKIKKIKSKWTIYLQKFKKQHLGLEKTVLCLINSFLLFKFQHKLDFLREVFFTFESESESPSALSNSSWPQGLYRSEYWSG